MCGITGIITFIHDQSSWLDRVDDAVSVLSHRGPDSRGIYRSDNVAMGHARLSIIDISEAASQPLTDPSGRYTIVYNGEIYNYRQLRDDLIKKGVQFKSLSDTEVVLQLYIHKGKNCLNKLNGFFSFAIHDKVNNSLFIARDRVGIKPLYFFQDQQKLIFASELKSILGYGISKRIRQSALTVYLQLGYIPSPLSIFENINKLEPGHYLIVENSTVERHCYYQAPRPNPGKYRITDYKTAKLELRRLLEDSVQRRMISDVPLGSFLSGGIDSSVITALASKHTDKLKTFSIGYRDEPYFDESKYAEIVARKYNTNHTTFSLGNDDLLASLHSALNSFDEPFGDSSALAVNLLSSETRKHVTVALSGDGADELFSGYNKHMAEYRVRNNLALTGIVKLGLPVWSAMPQSRNNAFTNLFRQLKRYGEGAKLNVKQRYLAWASIMNEYTCQALLNNSIEDNEASDTLEYYLANITGGKDLNDILYTDYKLVLENDMLVKVDRMSMLNSLEVRVPFLDHHIVEFAFSIPSAFKIDRSQRKKIVRDAFSDMLPKEIFKRGKHGFEVPLLKWFRNDLHGFVNEHLSEELIRDQQIFNYETIKSLLSKLKSNNPGDSASQIWLLLVFQYWWRKNLS